MTTGQVDDVAAGAAALVLALARLAPAQGAMLEIGAGFLENYRGLGLDPEDLCEALEEAWAERPAGSTRLLVEILDAGPMEVEGLCLVLSWSLPRRFELLAG